MSHPETADGPVHVESTEQFQDLVESADVVLVDFYADWCGPCKMLAPTVETLAEEGEALVLKVDIDELQELATEAGVRSVPTVQFYADGEPAERLIGVQDEDTLRDVIQSLK